MRSVGKRPLDEATMARMQAYFQGVRRKRFIALGLALIASLILFACASIFYYAPDGKEPDWLLPVSVVSAMTIGVALSYQKRFGEWLKNGKRQMLYECIEMFEGPNGETAEILFLSRELVRLNGKPMEGLGYVNVEQTADAPTSLIDPHFPVQHGQLDKFGVCRLRALTKEELWELRTYHRRDMTPGVRNILPLVTFLGVAPLLVGVLDSDPPYFWIGCAMCLFAAVVWWKVIEDLAKHRQMAKDLSGGRVVQIDPSNDSRLHSRIEILPNSQLVWREGDDPAAWRRVA